MIQSKTAPSRRPASAGLLLALAAAALIWLLVASLTAPRAAAPADPNGLSLFGSVTTHLTSSRAEASCTPVSFRATGSSPTSRWLLTFRGFPGGFNTGGSVHYPLAAGLGKLTLTLWDKSGVTTFNGASGAVTLARQGVGYMDVYLQDPQGERLELKGPVSCLE